MFIIPYLQSLCRSQTKISLIFICMFGILNNSLTVSVPGPDGQPDGGYSMMMFLMGWMVIATALFLLRPSSLRNRGDQKPARRGVCKLREWQLCEATNPFCDFDIAASVIWCAFLAFYFPWKVLCYSLVLAKMCFFSISGHIFNKSFPLFQKKSIIPKFWT